MVLASRRMLDYITYMYYVYMGGTFDCAGWLVLLLLLVPLAPALRATSLAALGLTEVYANGKLWQDINTIYELVPGQLSSPRRPSEWPAVLAGVILSDERRLWMMVMAYAQRCLLR